MSYTTRTTCRVCGSDQLAPLFSLGEQYVSDFPAIPEGTHPARWDCYYGPRVPIDVELCRSCSLVQQKHTAPQDFLYTRHYWYRSGVTQTMRDALADVAESVESLVDLQPGDVVLDIGSNDGTLLRSYGAAGIFTVGVEPATNLAEEGNRGVGCLIRDFWNAEAYFARGFDRAKIVTALGMFYDLEDPNAFIQDVARVLAPDGVFVAQLMCLKQTLERGDVGNFAHEHLEFYSYKSLRELLEQHGLTIFDIEENAVNGGSYRIFAKHANMWRLHSPNTLAVEKAEDEMRLDNPATYAAFFARLEANKAKCVQFVRAAVAAGKNVYVYGASTKGNVILQYYGLDRALITAAADRSPEKWGKFTVGTGIKIVSEEEFRTAAPDYALVLPYAFRDEFLQREVSWRARGGRFIFPLPEFEVV